MKKHGKILLALLLILGISMLGGCGKNENSSDDQEKAALITELQRPKTLPTAGPALLELPRI